MLKDLSHPPCMAPDGAPPCDCYLELFRLASKYERGLEAVKREAAKQDSTLFETIAESYLSDEVE